MKNAEEPAEEGSHRKNSMTVRVPGRAAAEEAGTPGTTEDVLRDPLAGRTQEEGPAELYRGSAGDAHRALLPH